MNLQLSGIEKCMEKIALDGWGTLPGTDPGALTRVMSEFGGETKVKWLRPRRGEEAVRPSLSAVHGLMAFPPHTDGAALAHPPRFIALFSERTYRTATHLFDGEHIGLDCALFSGSWLVRSSRRYFYAVPRRLIDDRVRWRLNPDLMVPVGGSAGDGDKAMRTFDVIPSVRIEWEPGLAVIWDNWRMLHSRESVDPTDGERTLLRVSVS